MHKSHDSEHRVSMHVWEYAMCNIQNSDIDLDIH